MYIHANIRTRKNKMGEQIAIFQSHIVSTLGSCIRLCIHPAKCPYCYVSYITCFALISINDTNMIASKINRNFAHNLSHVVVP